MNCSRIMSYIPEKVDSFWDFKGCCKYKFFDINNIVSSSNVTLSTLNIFYFIRYFFT